ncbi:MAG TPA: NHL repeat-containing protein, partial [Bryobacteraceae bacterium]|nr:NHL repeat-containing protein [Bryobacteraceae bacterium]
MQAIRALALAAASVAAGQVAGAQTIFNPAPSRIFGQAVLQQTGLLTAIAPNLVEGREFNAPQGLAVDTSANPPILYVADTGNNRVLAWKNAFGFTKGDKADLVIGQRDLLSSAPEGPGADLSTGLNQPVSVATDRAGNLYVVDAGNNRILRYPAPFAQTGALLSVDLILGQNDLNGRAPNAGQTAPNAHTFAFTTSAGVFRSGLAFDTSGNLWVSDPANNRVLRIPSTALSSGSNEPAADLVLGEPDFVTNSTPQNIDRSKKNYLLAPSGLAFDPKGRLFVADGANRVVVYAPPFAIAQSAARIMGVVVPAAGQAAPAIGAGTLGALTAGNQPLPPEGVVFVGANPYVLDTGNARILGYAPYDQWLAESVTFSPAATSVIGQQSFVANASNQGLAQPGASTLAGPIPNLTVGGPVAAVFAGTDLFVVDSGNHRVLSFPQQSSSAFVSADRVLGQLDFAYNSQNLIEGRELGFVPNANSCLVNGALAFPAGGGAAIDTSSNPPHVYISDPLNNRVLGFADYRKVNAGVKADLVIGQPDLVTGIINYPSSNPSQTSNEGLWSPEGL